MAQKKYMLLYLPSGKMIEVLSPAIKQDSGAYTFDWHLLVKNRTDLKKLLVRILEGKFPNNFYIHNEMPITFLEGKVLSCHFTFERVKENDYYSKQD